MSSNDLLSYSIMLGGDKAQYYKFSSPALGTTTAGLPSLVSSGKIVLPPLNSLKVPNSNMLTESNLNDFNKSYKSDYTYNYKDALTSSTFSPPNSVSFNSPMNKPEPVTISPPSSQASDSGKQDLDSEQLKNFIKRRQRLGPSCDSCRVRKVKCNAEIITLSSNYRNFNLSEFNLSPEQVKDLSANECVRLLEPHWSLIIANDKLIKFKSCTSCDNKKLDCLFSKGFTKEDILINKKSLKCKSDKNKITKSFDNSRKSSCFNCRKRKIKCSVNGENSKCENCFKRNSQCSFI